jgi:hypothetical protein
MAKNIKQIAEGLRAEIIGQVPESGGGAFGAAKVAKDAEALSQATDTGSGFFGCMHDAAEELDQIVEDAMRRRQLSGWLPNKEDFETLEWVCAETGRSLYDLLDEALGAWLQPWHQRQERSKQLAAGESDNAARKPIWERIQELIADIPEETWEEWPHNPEGIDLEAADVEHPETRKKLIEELGRRMNHLSETAYCAGWMHGLEEQVPALCDQAVKTGKIQPFGGTVVCPGLAARLLAMRDKLGHWVVPAVKGGYEPYVPSEKV